MKREIKFRAWDGQKMYIGTSLSEGAHHLGSWFEAHSCIHQEKESVFMQFTGLKDKNGKEIFESDIIKMHINQDWDWALEDYVKTDRFSIGAVEYDGCAFKIKLESWSPQLINACSDWCEVIGNIYETPELLKV